MTTKELRDLYAGRTRLALAEVGLVFRKHRYWWSAAGGSDAALMVSVSATFGRLSTVLTLAVTSPEFESMLTQVIGEDLAKSISRDTLFLPVKNLYGPPRPKDLRWREIWPPERARLEVADPSEIDSTVATIVSVWSTFVRPWVDELGDIERLAAEWHEMKNERRPLALHLLGRHEEATRSIADLSTMADPIASEIGKRYASNLTMVEPIHQHP